MRIPSQPSPKSPLETASEPLRIGHRGAAALGPENSLESIQAALAVGVDGVEIDVVLANRRLFVAHSLAELRRTSPTLDEALELLSESETLVMLDVKGAGFEEQVVTALKRTGLGERALVASFFPSVLLAVRELDPDLSTGLSYPHDRTGAGARGLPGPVVRAALAGMRRALPFRIGRMLRAALANTAVLHHLVVSRALVERCRAADVPVLAWTVNDAAALRRVTRLGVAGVVTDDPRIFPRIPEE